MLLFAAVAAAAADGPFTVRTGSCGLHSSGFCVSSPEWPRRYTSSSACEIDLARGASLRSIEFETELNFDYLSIGGTQFSGKTELRVDAANGTVLWVADHTTNAAGWLVCADLHCNSSAPPCGAASKEDAVCQHPSCGGGVGESCVMSPLADGARCDASRNKAPGSCRGGTCEMQPCAEYRQVSAADGCPADCRNLQKCSAQGATGDNNLGTVCVGDGGCGTTAPSVSVVSPCCSGAVVYARTIRCGNDTCSARPCMRAACRDGACGYEPSAEGTSCDDGDADTRNDTCDGTGVCAGHACAQYRAVPSDECPSSCEGVAPCAEGGGYCLGDGVCGTVAPPAGSCCGYVFARHVECGSGLCASGQCHDSGCADGKCSRVPLADGTPCDDGDRGTVGDACKEGVCTGDPFTTPSGGFEVRSGECGLLREGECVVSPEYPRGYGTDESCVVRATAESLLHVVEFSTEQYGDKLTVGGESYTGVNGPSGVVVAAGEEIQWSSNVYEEPSMPHAWHICRAMYCTGVLCPVPKSVCHVAVCGSSGNCTTRAVADGYPCDDGESADGKGSCLNGQCRVAQCPLLRPAATYECPSNCTSLPLCVKRGLRICRGTGRCGTTTTADNCCGKEDVYVEVVRCGVAVSCSAGQCSNATCRADGEGCAQDLLPDGTPCDDGKASTENDLCTKGVCSGVQRTILPSPLVHVSGGCRLMLGGLCLASPGYPARYGPSEECVVNATAASPLKVVSFSTEVGYDILTVNDRDYSGDRGPDGVTPTGSVRWSTDDSQQKGGFLLCQSVWCRGNECPVEPGGCRVPVCTADGTCGTAPVPAGSPCSDGDGTTAADVCAETGECRGVECEQLRLALPSECPSDCASLRPCSEANRTVCVADGWCGADAGAANCCGGWSVYVGVSRCGDAVCEGSQCAAASCGETGCSPELSADGTACDDGDVLTTNDQCSSGVCVGEQCPPFRPASPDECPASCENLDPCSRNGTTSALCVGGDGGWCGTNTSARNCCGAASVYVRRVRCGAAFCDASACKIPSCSAAGECVYDTEQTEGVPCDAGSFGVVDARCEAGACKGRPRSAKPGMFTVTEGSCAVTEGGRCVQSPGYPLLYGNSEGCVIGVEQATPITVRSFDTEYWYDNLTVNGFNYSGSESPAGVVPSGSIIWRSDAGIVATGFKLCMALYCGGEMCSVSTCVERECDGGSCPTAPFPEGTSCDDGDVATVNDTCRIDSAGAAYCAGIRPKITPYTTKSNVFCSQLTADGEGTWLPSLVDCRAMCDSRDDCVGCAYNCKRNHMTGAYVLVVGECTEAQSECGSYIRYKSADEAATDCEVVTVGPHPDASPAVLDAGVSFAGCDDPVTAENRLNTDYPGSLARFAVSVRNTTITVTRVDGVGGEGASARGWSMRLRFCCHRSRALTDYDVAAGQLCSQTPSANQSLTLSQCASLCGEDSACGSFAVRSEPSAECVTYSDGECGFLPASGWTHYRKKELCADSPLFRDERGYSCAQWSTSGRNCGSAASRWGYTAAGQSDLVRNCRRSCGWCMGCPWLTPTSEVGVIECANGERSQPHDWGFCSRRGGRLRCPPELPVMCAAADCAVWEGVTGSGSHCCELNCTDKGGPRPCDGPDGGPPAPPASAPCGTPARAGGCAAGSSPSNQSGNCECDSPLQCCSDDVCTGHFGAVCLRLLDECAGNPCGDGQNCTDPVPFEGFTTGRGTFRCTCGRGRESVGSPATCTGTCAGWKAAAEECESADEHPSAANCTAVVTPRQAGSCLCASETGGFTAIKLPCGHPETTCSEVCNPCNGVVCTTAPCGSVSVCDESTGKCSAHSPLPDGSRCTDGVPGSEASCVSGVCVGYVGSCGRSCLQSLGAAAAVHFGWDGADGADARCAVAACVVPEGYSKRYWRVSNLDWVDDVEVSQVVFAEDADCSHPLIVQDISCASEEDDRKCRNLLSPDESAVWSPRCNHCKEHLVRVTAQFDSDVAVGCVSVRGPRSIGKHSGAGKQYSGGLRLESSEDGKHWQTIARQRHTNTIVSGVERQCTQQKRANGFVCPTEDGGTGRCFADPDPQVSRCRACGSMLTHRNCARVSGCFWASADDGGDSGVCVETNKRTCGSPVDPAREEVCAGGAVVDAERGICVCTEGQRCCSGRVCSDGVSVLGGSPQCVPQELDECDSDGYRCGPGQQCTDPKPWLDSLNDWVCRCPGTASSRWAVGGGADCTGPCLGWEPTDFCGGEATGRRRNCSVEIGEAGYCDCGGSTVRHCGDGSGATTCRELCNPCSGAAASSCPPLECHAPGVCNPAYGRCEYAPTTGGLCAGGTCVEGVCVAPVPCGGTQCVPSGACIVASCVAGECKYDDAGPLAKDSRTCGWVGGGLGVCDGRRCASCASVPPAECETAAACVRVPDGDVQCVAANRWLGTPKPTPSPPASDAASHGPTWGAAIVLAVSVGVVLSAAGAFGAVWYVRSTRRGRMMMRSVWRPLGRGRERHDDDHFNSPLPQRELVEQPGELFEGVDDEKAEDDQRP